MIKAELLTDMKDLPYSELKEFAEALLHKVGDLSISDEEKEAGDDNRTMP